MKKQFSSGEGLGTILVKAVLLSFAGVVYSLSYGSQSTMISLFVSILTASILSPLLVNHRFRLIPVALIGIFVFIGSQFFSFIFLRYIAFSPPESGLLAGTALLFSGMGFGIAFLSRGFSQRFGWVNVFELCLVVGSVVSVFFAHRDFNLQQPRTFSDWALMGGYDPIVIMRIVGVAAAVMSVFLLLRRSSFLRVLVSFLFLLLLLAGLFRIFEGVRVPTNLAESAVSGGTEDNEEEGDSSSGEGSDSKDSDEGGKGDKGGTGGNRGDGSGPSFNNDPHPVAIAVFYDDFEPADGIFYFRQSVLSRYDGNHLVASDMDEDVFSQFPLDEASVAVHEQSVDSHINVKTSMFLLREHPRPPALSHAIRLGSIENPDPKLFVASYSVLSLGMRVDYSRMLGSRSIPGTWSSEKRAHYLEIPDDPRYKALSDIIVRDIDPRYSDDMIVKALSIKRWLEQEGFYTMKTTHIDSKDPTASFLFGTLRGYCVHFAHSAVFLLRSQGIASRVAVGYGVDNRLRGLNSAVLILGDQAHAWPEIFVDGIGWVTFDIYPIHSDQAPRPFVDQDLESLFGELARNDKSGGRSAEAVAEPFRIPWKILGTVLLYLLGLLILLSYFVKYFRQVLYRFRGGKSRVYWSLAMVTDRLHMAGYRRSFGETHECFASRVSLVCGSMGALTGLYLGVALGGKDVSPALLSKAEDLRSRCCLEIKDSVRSGRRFAGWLSPLFWRITR